MWDAEIMCFKQLPLGLVAQLGEPLKNVLSITLKLPAEQPADIFDHHSPRSKVIDQFEDRREEVSVVSLAELLSSNAEGRTRNAAGDEVDKPEVPWWYPPDQGFVVYCIGRPPSRPMSVLPERFCGVGVDLNQRKVLEASLMQTYRLTPGTGTNFYAREHALDRTRGV